MAFEYEALEATDQLQLLQDRLRQLEADHFSAGMTKRTAEDARDVGPDQKRELIARVEAQMQTLEQAIVRLRNERDELVSQLA